MASLPSLHPGLALHLSDQALTPIISSALPPPNSRYQQRPPSTRSAALASLSRSALAAYSASRRLELGSPVRIIVEYASAYSSSSSPEQPGPFGAAVGPVILNSFIEPLSSESSALGLRLVATTTTTTPAAVVGHDAGGDDGTITPRPLAHQDGERGVEAGENTAFANADGSTDGHVNGAAAAVLPLSSASEAAAEQLSPKTITTTTGRRRSKAPAGSLSQSWTRGAPPPRGLGLINTTTASSSDADAEVDANSENKDTHEDGMDGTPTALQGSRRGRGGGAQSRSAYYTTTSYQLRDSSLESESASASAASTAPPLLVGIVVSADGGAEHVVEARKAAARLEGVARGLQAVWLREEEEEEGKDGGA